ncbi:MAG: dihydroneopterin aldolase [Bacteroidales bacterium]|nr:dihydroneopterin aldolase [Bacteroidales bacterium]
MSKQIIIELEGMEFHAFHGCFYNEKRDGNTFLVDFKGVLEAAALPGDPSQSDRLEDTVDYGLVYQIVKDVMDVDSDLIEHVAGRIVRAISEQLPQFPEFSGRVSKKQPPSGGRCAWARVTLEHKR